MLHPQTYRTCSPLTHQKDRKAVTAAMADWLGGGGGVCWGVEAERRLAPLTHTGKF